MNKILLFNLRIVFAITVFIGLGGIGVAQTTRKYDLIIKRDSVKIEAFILEVDEINVKYKKRTDEDGPTFLLPKREIASVIYGNGEVEAFVMPKEVYFDEVPIPPISTYSQPVAPVRDGSRSISAEQLKSNYSLYLRKAASYKKMTIVGSAGGGLLAVLGIALMSSAVNNGSYNGYYNGYSQLYGGSLLFVGGIGAGISLTIVGTVKKRSYNKKAMLVRDELRRRKELSFQPGFSPLTQSASIGLRLRF